MLISTPLLKKIQNNTRYNYVYGVHILLELSKMGWACEIQNRHYKTKHLYFYKYQFVIFNYFIKIMSNKYVTIAIKNIVHNITLNEIYK